MKELKIQELAWIKSLKKSNLLGLIYKKKLNKNYIKKRKIILFLRKAKENYKKKYSYINKIIIKKNII